MYSKEIQDLINKINNLKKDNNAIILAHNYMIPEIFEVADSIGDSFELSVYAQKTDADIIIFAGVHFMAEAAKLLNPNKKVLLPSLKAGCFMADTINAHGLKLLKNKYPESPVVVYMNTSAEIKALSNSTLTSSNAVKVVESFKEDSVIFAPDKHLCEYVQANTKKKLIPWQGFCHVHTTLTPEYLKEKFKEYPDAHAIIHPETPERVTKLAHHVCGTGGMSKYIAKKNDINTFLIGTEEGMSHKLQRDFPNKKIIPLMKSCINMKQITLENILESLISKKHEIMVKEDIFEKARNSMLEMLKRS
jgi:quinolinate synthase